MKRKNNIQVFEHQKLYYSEDGPFKEVHWKALARYADLVNEEYYEVLGKGIKFSNYVGVIQAGNLTIEILPKTDSPRQTAQNNEEQAKDPEKKLWRQVLVEMLKECRLLTADQSNKAFLNLSSQSLLDIYLELFLSETEKLLHEGLIKKYQKKEGNRLSLKGQLLFTKNLSQNIVHEERFFVRHTVYTSENIFNQLLYKTILAIRKISNNSFINDKVNRLLFSFPELQDIKVNHQTFGKLVYDRKTERYKDALMISKMILLHFHPDIMGGNENVIAILFDMNRLWEEFVFRRLKKEEKGYHINLSQQPSKQFWTPDHVDYCKTVRPDMILSYTENKKCNSLILDTKWKILKNLIPSDEDLKQMFVYNLLWKCKESVLIYPSSSIAYSSGRYEYLRSYVDGNTCTARTMCVLNDDQTQLNKNFGRDLLVAILGKSLCDSLRR